MADRHNIEQELVSISSTVAGLPRHTPYHVPTGYFEQLPDVVLLQAKKEMPKTVSVLAAPDNYFEQLPQQLLQKISETNTAPPATKRIPLKAIGWAVAAMMIFAVGLGSYDFSNQQPLSVAQQLNQIPANDLLAYVQDNAEDFELTTLANNIDITDENVDMINNDEIEAYIKNIGWQ